MNDSLKKSLDNSGKTKMLSLDGGGLRGILTLGILKKLETDIQDSYGKGTRICDYFDIIGGTSTGSIIASGLAIGKSVDELIELYMNLGTQIFSKGFIGRKTRSWKMLRAFFKENYSSEKLEQYLKSPEGFSNLTLGDQDKLQCGLVINSKRADTYSLWSVTNHPDGKYYGSNESLRLWELCKASSSAPYYFKPTALDIKTSKGNSIPTAFIDGGVSLANNPAWQMFLVATVPSFGYKRITGEDNISIISIGTGNGLKKEIPKKLLNKRAVAWASSLPDLFMVDALEMNQTILSSFGKNIGEDVHIDGQFGNMNDVNYYNEKLFTFQRYNAKFNKNFLIELGIDLTDKEIASLLEMDHVENMDKWLEIGQKYGDKIAFKLQK